MTTLGVRRVEVEARALLRTAQHDEHRVPGTEAARRSRSRRRGMRRGVALARHAQAEDAGLRRGVLQRLELRRPHDAQKWSCSSARWPHRAHWRAMPPPPPSTLDPESRLSHDPTDPGVQRVNGEKYSTDGRELDGVLPGWQERPSRAGSALDVGAVAGRVEQVAERRRVGDLDLRRASRRRTGRS